MVKRGSNGKSAGGEGRGGAFEAVEDDDHDGDLAAHRLDGIDRLERRAAGRGHVVDDRHRRTRLERALDQVSRAMGLGFLSDQEAAQVATARPMPPGPASRRRSGRPPSSGRRRPSTSGRSASCSSTPAPTSAAPSAESVTLRPST